MRTAESLMDMGHPFESIASATDGPGANPLVRMFRVSKRYAGKQALADVTLDIARNDFIFITGPSGAGKSTLIKMLYLGEKISTGSILIDGVNLARITPKQVPQLRRKFGIIFQDFKLIPGRTVYENVSLVLEVAGVRPAEIRPRVEAALIRVGIADRADAFPQILSGGEKQRVAVARAMVGEPMIVLADEPTGSLDPDSAQVIFDMFKSVHAAGTTVIIATHDRDMIRSYPARIIRLEDGRLTDEFDFQQVSAS